MGDANAWIAWLTGGLLVLAAIQAAIFVATLLTTRTIERAWVSVAGASFSHLARTSPAEPDTVFKLKLHNSGKLPATLVSFLYMLEIGEEPKEQPDYSDSVPQPLRGIVAPSATETATNIFHGNLMSSEQHARFMRGNLSVRCTAS